MAIFAAFLRQKSVEVTVIDQFGMDPWHLDEQNTLYWQGKPLKYALEDKNATDLTRFDAVFLYALSAMSHADLLESVSFIRSLGACKLIVFENAQAVTGYDLSKIGTAFLDKGADALLVGEPYGNWPDIAQWVAHSQAAAPVNLITRTSPQNSQRVFQNPVQTPIPAWDLFPYANYWKLSYSHGPKTGAYFPMLTSRGCPYPCTFCVVPSTNQQKWRARSAQAVVAEMETLYQQYGVQEFQWEDLNSTIDRARIVAICQGLLEKRFPIRFKLVSGTKVETLDADLLDIMAKAGCDYISISPESGSPKVLQAMRKPFDHAHGIAMVEAMAGFGIRSQACFVLGHPGEKAEDLAATQAYVRTLVQCGLSEAAFFVLSPLPGSALNEEKVAVTHYDQALWSFSPEHRTDYPEIQRWRKRLVRQFLLWKIRYQFGTLLKQTWNAVRGTPETKMEMLPRRVLSVWRMRRRA